MATIRKLKLKDGQIKYQVQWYDATGKRRTRTTHNTGKRAEHEAHRIAQKAEAEKDARRWGEHDDEAEERQQRRKSMELPVVAMLDEWEADKKREDRNARYIRDTRRAIQRLVDMLGWQAMSDITVTSMKQAIDELRLRGGTRRNQEEVKPASNATIRDYIRAVKGFCAWFCVEYELPDSMLAGLSAPDPSKTRKHVRRAMRIEEWRVLEASTKAGPDRRGVSGPERALTYAVMLATGYRKEETRKLTRGSLQRAGGSWALTLPAKDTKNGNAATQRIPDGLAAKLHQHTATKLPAAPLLSMVEPFGVVRVLREDLAAARESWIKEMETDKERENREQSDFLTYEDHQGRKLDVHALRHTCGHWLTEAGVKLSDVCAIMRHSSIKLTVDTYGHIEPGVMDEAAVKMGDALKVSS